MTGIYMKCNTGQKWVNDIKFTTIFEIELLKVLWKVRSLSSLIVRKFNMESLMIYVKSLALLPDPYFWKGDWDLG